MRHRTQRGPRVRPGSRVTRPAALASARQQDRRAEHGPRTRRGPEPEPWAASDTSPPAAMLMAVPLREVWPMTTTTARAAARTISGQR